ncbi:Signal transduction histidine-protein kinase BarA [Marinomonas aquimarina]|uniref:histidine kinase n=1 Tax=Marinomonas aquimarina TaxID=295068 RepID=A0A1A8TQI2_9GAMM|nr:response regulator [Marinomonas aquimarina]SBS35071.1 Signal transduction histidine-protein kinase BarA [Marinomonas aquimarina]
MRSSSSSDLHFKLWKAIFLPVLGILICSAAILYVVEALDNKEQFEYINRYQAEQIANTSEYALLFNDRNLISSNIHGLLRQQDIVGVSYFNSQGDLIDSVGQIEAPQGTLPNQARSYYQDDISQYITIAPIYYANLNNNQLSEHPFNEPNSALLADAIGLSKTPQQELLGWIQVSSSTQRLSLDNIMIALLTLGYLVVATLICAILCWRYAARISQPWLNITKSLSLITRGDYETANAIRLPSYLNTTREALTYISERLKNYRTELENEINQITKETRENSVLLEEKSAQLHIANKEAMESNRLKTQFLANISHEVRTPLNAILGYSNLLQKDNLCPQQQVYVDTIAQSTNDLLATIGNILDFSKIEAGKMVVLESEDFNIKDTIDDVLHSLASTPFSEAKDIDLIPNFNESLPDWVKGDKTRLRQILNNLVGNAIKFTHKGSIQVFASSSQLSATELDVRIEVVDTGCGIANEKLSQLFKPFSQVDSSHTRSYAGTGLGLVITKKLIEQMGGSIAVNSELERGSNFYFNIRLQCSHKSSDALPPLNQHIIVYEPGSNYREYLASCLTQLSVSHDFTSSVEHFMTSLHNSKQAYQAALICTGITQTDAEEAAELTHYLAQRFQLPTLVLSKPSSHLTLHAQQYQLASRLAQKPISLKRLYAALQNLAQPDMLIAPPSATQPEQDTWQHLSGLHMLAVDDTAINLQLLGHWLEPHNIHLSLAYSGQQAIDMAQQQQFDLILMDIQMPNMDGMEATKQLRKLEHYQETPIIALTAHALAQEQQSILASGMNAYLTKPINEETLLNTLSEWCSTNKNLTSQVEEELSDVFDVEKALSMAGNRVAAAKDLFDMLMQSLSEDRRLLIHHFETQDLDKLIATVHRIHGASKYSGTIELTKHANFLETHLKELGFDEVEEVFDDFMASLEHLENIQTLIPWPQASQTPTQTAAHPTN